VIEHFYQFVGYSKTQHNGLTVLLFVFLQMIGLKEKMDFKVLRVLQQLSHFFVDEGYT